jgi:hypothetical protein
MHMFERDLIGFDKPGAHHLARITKRTGSENQAHGRIVQGDRVKGSLILRRPRRAVSKDEGAFHPIALPHR